MKPMFVASYLNQDMYLYLYLYVLFVSWGNEFHLQPHFLFLGYEAYLLGVLSVVTPTQSSAKLLAHFGVALYLFYFHVTVSVILKRGQEKN